MQMRPSSACPGRLATALVAAGVLAACRFEVQEVAVGSPIDFEAYHALEPGRDDRGSILAALGPPLRVWYTLDEEFLEYRHGGHRGTDLSFLISSSDTSLTIFGFSRVLVNLLFPFEQPAEFDTQGPETQAQAGVTRRAANASVPVAVTDVVSVLNRRVRYDVVTLQLDRDTHRLKRKQLIRAVPETGVNELARSSILRNED